MKIKGPKKLVKRAAFAARLLDVEPELITLEWVDGNSVVANLGNNEFRIKIQSNIYKYALISHVGHEMVHLRQMLRKELQYCPETGQFVWLGTRYTDYETLSDEYFLSPWEMEARALEAWIEHRWEVR